MKMPDRQRWKRLSPLLDRLLDADEAEQSLHLAELRRHDSGLAGELEALLQAARDAQRSNFLGGDGLPPKRP